MFYASDRVLMRPFRAAPLEVDSLNHLVTIDPIGIQWLSSLDRKAELV
jgi:hypothetical protein